MSSGKFLGIVFLRSLLFSLKNDCETEELWKIRLIYGIIRAGALYNDGKNLNLFTSPSK